jgi:hypothetical protein
MLRSGYTPFLVKFCLILGVCILRCADAPGAEGDHCGVDGIALQVLGPGGPELQDKRASTGYLLWWNGQARVLVDIGGGAAFR